jgi:hypothetical protein
LTYPGRTGAPSSPAWAPRVSIYDEHAEHLEQHLDQRAPDEPILSLSLTDDLFPRPSEWARWQLGIPPAAGMSASRPIRGSHRPKTPARAARWNRQSGVQFCSLRPAAPLARCGVCQIGHALRIIPVLRKSDSVAVLGLAALLPVNVTRKLLGERCHELCQRSHQLPPRRRLTTRRWTYSSDVRSTVNTQCELILMIRDRDGVSGRDSPSRDIGLGMGPTI